MGATSLWGQNSYARALVGVFHLSTSYWIMWLWLFHSSNGQGQFVGCVLILNMMGKPPLVTRYINGLRYHIQHRISLVPVYTLDDAYNLAIRVENQLAKSNRSTLFPSTNRNKNVSSVGQSSYKLESSPPIQKEATGGKINLTTREHDYDGEEHEERVYEEIETDICQPTHHDLDSDFYADGEYSAQSCVIRRIMLTPKLVDKFQRHNLFRTRCVIHQKVFDVIINSGSVGHLPTEKHPNPYRTGWIKSVGKIKVTERCKIPFEIGKYKEEVMCDIVDMDACHILLGRPWEYDVNAIHKCKEKTYSFIINGVKKVLVPLMDYNKPKDSEATRNNLMILNHGEFEEEIKGSPYRMI
ncbi:hypothetical protein CTI12_AA501670 [Artemisia annua]|uniref:Reverse transcriptase domain-containing protein n=1 Tax=Artemisia annua TaxID=35608 RepID=A0A2U1LD54_ARTAN|nr:hypothetical protein CTI12_AA501670 [Artemisia annua]